MKYAPFGMINFDMKYIITTYTIATSRDLKSCLIEDIAIPFPLGAHNAVMPQAALEPLVKILAPVLSLFLPPLS